MKTVVLIATSCAFIAGSAQAQDAAFAARMREVNAAVPLPDKALTNADALATLQAIAKQRGACVPTGVRMEPPTPATADRLAIRDIQAGKLTNVWLDYGVATGCAGVAVTRFIVLLLPDGSVRARVVNPGRSLTSPSLMRDTSTAAAVAAYAKVKAVDATCDGRDLDMVSSSIKTRSADLSPDFYGARYKGSWAEVWSYRVCGRVAAVPVSFRADGTGGAYTSVSQQGVTLTGK